MPKEQIIKEIVLQFCWECADMYFYGESGTADPEDSKPWI